MKIEDLEKALQYFVIAVPENEEQAKAYFWARKGVSALRSVSREQELEAENKELKERIVNWRKYMAPTREQVELAQPCKPLTLEQLREMDGKPAWCEEVGKWALVSVSDAGKWKGIPFALFEENGARFEWNIEDREMSLYSYPPAQQRWIKEANTPLTNGDRIRAMDNKELSEWLCSIMVSECCDRACPGREFCELGHTGLLDWLQATYREE